MKKPILYVVAWIALLALVRPLLGAEPVTLIAAGSVWKYLDNGTDQGTAWTSPTFDDGGWASGPAPLGYGGNGEVTVVSFGPNAGSKYITTYFRRAFTVADPSIYQSARLGVVRDDGVVIYLNGAEVFRSNMPVGPVNYLTTATTAVGGADETTFFTALVNPALLVAGANVFAVELHQSSGTSSDLGFDFQFTVSTDPVINLSPSVNISSPLNNAIFTVPASVVIQATASDSDGTVSLVEFFQGASKLGEDAVSPYEYSWIGVGQGVYELSAVATDNLGARATSAVVNVSVIPASPPFLVSVSPAPGTIAALSAITVNFSEPVVGVAAAWLWVNGEPAVTLAGSGTSYTFGFSQPPPGPVQITWDPDQSITDLEGNAFDSLAASAMWNYSLVDSIPPQVQRLSPTAGATVTALTQVEVYFNELVTGVTASDLLINGQAAGSVTGSGTGPYLFSFSPPGAGTVQMSWASGHGIQDEASVPNNFEGGLWTYNLNPSFAPNLVINEILADNLTGVEDEDGQKHDWVELRNRGATAVSLLGMSLTDDPEVPAKWVCPGITLGAGQYVVIFASGKDRATTVAGKTNHLNFQLNVGGGHLGLFNANYPRQALDQFVPEYPELRGDVSYGRTAADALAWFRTPTPGSANAEASALTGIVEPPHPSVDSGFFNHPFELVLSSPTPGARIFYTLDGSPPTEQSSEYVVPVYVQGTARQGVVTVRAAGFVVGQLPSLVTTRSYIFPDHVLTQPADPDGFPAIWDSPCSTGNNCSDSAADYEMDPQVINDVANNYRALARKGLTDIPTISIVTRRDLLFGPAQGVYVRREDFNHQQVNAELILPDGTTGFNIDCGLEIVGGTSPNDQGTYWKSRKLSMRLMFKGEFGGTGLDYPVFPDSPVDRFDTLILDAGLNNVWSYNGGSSPDAQRLRSQYMRDQYMSDLQNALGGLAPHGQHVHVYLNGLYWGIHGMHERPDDSFAAEYLGGDKAEYDVLKHRITTVVSGSSASYSTMLTIARSGLANNSTYENLQQYLDVPNYIDYMIVNIWGGNTDWAHQNWYASKRRTPDGRWRYHSWDAEHVLESINDNVTGKNDANGPTELFQLLRQNAEFRLLFADHVHRHFFNGGQFYVDPANPRYDPARPDRNRPAALWMARQSKIDPAAMVTESARWGDTGQTGTSRENNPLTVNREYRDEFNALMGISNATGHSASYNAFPTRSGIAFNQISTVQLYPNVVAPSFSQHGGRVSSGFGLTMTGPAGTTIYYTTNGLDPRVYGSGKVSDHALVYGGTPVILTTSATVKARTRSGATWSALNEASFIIEELTSPLRITEIMYNPVGGDFYEFLELRNVGAIPIDLGSHVFSGINFVFPVGATLDPGATIVLANNNSPAAFAARYPGVSVFGYFGGNLASGGERLVLKNAAGKIILSVQFDDENGWPTSPDGQGPSLEIIDENGDFSDPTNWRASSEANGTPGLPPADPPPSQVVLNEVMTENLAAVNVAGRFPDFVEVYNRGPGQVNLGGWSLTDDNDPRRYVFPPNTLLASDGYLVVWCDTNAGPGLHTGFALDREGETLVLYDPNTNRVDGLSFGLVPADYTLGRIDGDWQLSVPTTNAPNVAAALAGASSLGLNEWMANPVPGQDDWLELFNRSTTAPVALQGIYLGTSNALFRFRLPAFLPPRGFLQLFAEERSGRDQLDFRLPAGAGAIILYDATGLERERVTYGPQASGVSAGRLPDGSVAAPVTFPGSVSPGAGNYRVNYNGPVFTEVLARNQAAVLSPWGTYADFVELRNASGVSFDLSGMSLSTSPGEPGSFVFAPGTSLAGNGYLAIWWDGSRPAQTNGPNFNTGTALEGSGGGLYLFTAQGQSATGLEYGFQVADLSIGLQGTSWQLLSAPTPGAANATPASLGVVANLRLNEWMANPNGGDDWFEIYNRDPLPVRMDGLFLTDDPSIAAQTQFAVGPLSYIGGHSWVRWEADGARGKGPNHVSFNLDATGETILLYATNLTVIDAVSFGLQTAGASQGRLPDGENNIIQFATTASPEASNYLPLPDVVVNEVLSHTDLPFEDAVELHNLSDADLDISGCYLSDNQLNFRKFRLPPGSVVPAHGFLVVYEYQLNGGTGSQVPFTFDSVWGEDAWLTETDPGDALTGFRARGGFGPAANGISFGRYLTSVGVDFPAQIARTFGQDSPASVGQFRSGTGKTNAGPLIGPVVVNEIMYYPPLAGETTDNALLEYVELYNITGTPVSLFDPAHPTNTWRLAGGVNFTFPEGVSLLPHSYALVVSFDPILAPVSLALFRAHYALPVEVPVYGPYQGHLSNEGESVQLARPDNPQGPGPDEGVVPQILVERVEFDDAVPWPVEAAGGGTSLQRRRPHHYGNDPVNWKGELPTPGRANVPGSGYADTDLDGLPDDYEVAQGFNPNLAGDALQDADADNRSNYDEFLAGTDPRSVASYLAAPTLTSQPQNQVVEEGGATTLSVTAGGSALLHYQWYRNGLPVAGATGSTLAFSQVNAGSVGRYHVVVWNTAGYVVSSAASLVVNVPPRISQHPASQTVSNGQSVTFTVAATGTGPLRYQWQYNGVDISGANSAGLSLSNVQIEQQGEYRVVVTDDLASATSTPAFLKVLAPPTFVRLPESQTVVEGSDVTFTVISRGTLPMGYRWRVGGTTLRNVARNSFLDTFTMTNVQLLNNSNRITCILTNQLNFAPGVLSSPAALLLVLPDADKDGMDNAFETNAGLDPNDPSDALLDADADGVSNGEEYMAGTDPNDPDSFLKVEIAGGQQAGVALRFRAQSGKSYSLLYKESLEAVDWAKLVDVELESQARDVDIIDPSADSVNQRVYRLVTPKRLP